MNSNPILDHPIALFFVSVIVLWAAALLGVAVRRKSLEEAERDDFNVILGATLTLLGLIIGFSFSMATSRYDVRKTFEEAEANAIGTEYVRADLLPNPAAANVAGLLRTYLDARIAFYTSDEGQLPPVDAKVAELQTQLWSAVRPAAESKPTPVTALVVAGMNDVLNSQGYTQAAYWNRIPLAAWILMIVIAICSNLLVGFGSRRATLWPMFLLIVPILASIAFMLIADLDSPRGGLIRVAPENLVSLADSLKR